MERLEHPIKFKTNKLSLNPVLVGPLLAVSILALVVTEDTDQPIHIESDQQSLDIQGSVVIFTGNVIVAQGTIKISADKVVVTRPGDEQSKEVIDGYGKPTISYQMQDSGKPVESHASQIHYELAKNFIVLTGNTYLQQVDSSIKGDKIIYLVEEQRMQALSNRDRRVTTVPVPPQLQDKNNKGQTPAQKRDN